MIDLIVQHEKSRGEIAMGDFSSADEALRGSWFDTVVYAAREFQPSKKVLIARGLVGKRVIYAPFDDNGELPRDQAKTAARAAEAVAHIFDQGGKVLVTCMSGRNRSGLITALAIHLSAGIGGVEAFKMVRARRHAPDGPALSNPAFQKLLANIPPKPLPKQIQKIIISGAA